MPVISTYRTTRSLAVADDQLPLVMKLAEFLRDCREVFNLDVVEIQTIAGRVYVRLSDRLPNLPDGAADPDYFEMEPMNI